VFAALVVARVARAADHTFTVNTTADGVDANPGDGLCATSGGLCTLRAAVMESNHTASGTVEIVVPANADAYVLTIPPGQFAGEDNGDLDINRSVTITGSGAAHTIVDGNGKDRVFASTLPVDYTISGLTIRNGASPYAGGGIYQQGTFGSLRLTLCVVTANAAPNGGGLYTAGDLTLDRSTVGGNTATFGDGGGILGGQLTVIVASTISGNHANGVGGGSLVNAGQIFYSTIAGNTAVSSGGGPGSGGGGVYHSSATSMAVRGTIISGNTDVAPGPTVGDSDCYGTFSGSKNIIGPNAAQCTIPATVTDPLLGPLQLNGGEIPTRALPAGSPAVDTGDSTCALFTSMDAAPIARPAPRATSAPTSETRTAT
jgi:CSLREA domain-containing protein